MADSVTLHSSWRGLIASFVGAGLLFAAGFGAVLASDGATGAWVVFAVGTFLVAGVAFDVPITSVFDADGVTRRPLLRRHRFDWDDVDQLTRARPGIAAAARDLNPGGLVAKVGRRRYLLVDQCESRSEFDALVDLLGDDRLAIDDLVVPPAGVDPTWTYRRSRWKRTVDG